MSMIAWIFLGTITGYVSSELVNEPGKNVIIGIMLVIVGAIYGGFFLTWLNAAGVTGFKLYSMFVELVGVIALLVVCHAVFVRRSSTR